MNVIVKAQVVKFKLAPKEKGLNIILFFRERKKESVISVSSVHVLW